MTQYYLKPVKHTVDSLSHLNIYVKVPEHDLVHTIYTLKSWMNTNRYRNMLFFVSQ